MGGNIHIEQVTKKECREYTRREREIAKELAIKKQRLVRVIRWISGIIVVMLAVFGVAWYRVARPKTPLSDIVSRNGIHWHPELILYVGGIQQEIPTNIGLGAVHQPVHTHDDLPRIHLEFERVVRTQDILLGQFFKNWDKDIRSFGANMEMTVNGEVSTEYENYVMKDKDKIILRYE